MFNKLSFVFRISANKVSVKLQRGLPNPNLLNMRFISVNW